MGRGGGGGADGTHPLEHRGHRQGRRQFPALPDRLNRLGQHRSQQFGRWYTAAHPRCRGGTGRGADHQIGGLCQIETSLGQTCDDADLPRLSGSPTTTENQSNIVNHRFRLPGVPCYRGAPGDTYVNRPTVTAEGAPTSIHRSWVSPRRTVSRSTRTYHPIRSRPPLSATSSQLLTRPGPHNTPAEPRAPFRPF